jgi:mutator protein MutT
MDLGIVHKGNQVLLGMKKRGFGQGRWNGFGGKVHSGETIEESLVREGQEEMGITATDFTEVGLLKFTFNQRAGILEVHIFLVTGYTGVPHETEEMRPQWFNQTNIPYQDMWSDDPFWLPHVLFGKKVVGKFHFDQPADNNQAANILAYELEIQS